MFFYSDPHFGHKRVIELCNRPYADTDAMEADFIRRYNAKVGPNDTVIWCGDCFFCSREKAKEIMAKLNGKKILVRGNHDQSPSRMLTYGFDFVCEFLCLKIAGKMVKVCHYPYGPGLKGRIRAIWKKFDLRYLERRPKRVKGQYLIHGHTHSAKRQDGTAIHVGLDAWNYNPVPITEIESIIMKIENNGRNKSK